MSSSLSPVGSDVESYGASDSDAPARKKSKGADGKGKGKAKEGASGSRKKAKSKELKSEEGDLTEKEEKPYVPRKEKPYIPREFKKDPFAVAAAAAAAEDVKPLNVSVARGASEIIPDSTSNSPAMLQDSTFGAAHPLAHQFQHHYPSQFQPQHHQQQGVPLPTSAHLASVHGYAHPSAPQHYAPTSNFQLPPAYPSYVQPPPPPPPAPYIPSQHGVPPHPQPQPQPEVDMSMFLNVNGGGSEDKMGSVMQGGEQRIVVDQMMPSAQVERAAGMDMDA